MPWSHILPDYARARPSYGQNLVELAATLDPSTSSGNGLSFIDIGANIGDSTLQVLNSVEGRALCIEGDEYWARYLRMNVGADPRVAVEEAMLATPETDASSLTPRRRGGSTTFQPGIEEREGSAVLSVEEVRTRHPEFADVRLIKSDTDGFDPLLVPEAARAWSQSAPVLFFEFDPGLTRRVAQWDPNRVWDELAELGYSRLAVWDNTGDPLGQLDLADATEAATILEAPPDDLGYGFWDVAARRADDTGAAAAFDGLMSPSFDPRAVPPAR